MKLGNSNSNQNKINREKNYLTKNKKEALKIKHQEEADEFKIWFGNNYLNIIEELTRKNILNDDVVNDTFLKLYELQQYKGCILDNRSYFMRSYYTNYFQHNMKEKKRNETHTSFNQSSKWEDTDATHIPITSMSDKLVDTTTSDKEEYEDTITINKIKVKQVLNYVYNKYPLIQFELYKIYTHCQPKLSYKKLSNITQININYIAESIKTIKQDVNNNKNIIFNKKLNEYNTNNNSTNCN